MLETSRWLATTREDEIPAVLHTKVCTTAKMITGNPDPFSGLKRFSNEQALKMLPSLEKMIEESSDAKEAFQLAVKTAICGNAIDFEVENYDFSMERFDTQFLSCIEKDFAVDHTVLLMKQLERSKKIIYILDNAGEIVFDKLLINLIKRTYGCEVWAAVKEKPVVNDALLDDAERVGLTSVAQVITTGNDHIGVELDSSSETFLNHLTTSDLIIAKGQGCYETLTELESSLNVPVYYLLIAKCPVVAEDLAVPMGSSVVKFSNPKTSQP